MSAFICFCFSRSSLGSVSSIQRMAIKQPMLDAGRMGTTEHSESTVLQLPTYPSETPHKKRMASAT